jgi:hypothetical protein
VAARPLPDTVICLKNKEYRNHSGGNSKNEKRIVIIIIEDSIGNKCKNQQICPEHNQQVEEGGGDKPPVLADQFLHGDEPAKIALSRR